MTGIHAAQIAHIQCERRGGAVFRWAACGARRKVLGERRNDDGCDGGNLPWLTVAIDRHLVGAGDDIQSFGPEAGVDLGAAGEDGERIGLSDLALVIRIP